MTLTEVGGSAVGSWWKVSGTIQTSLTTKGARRCLYRMAFQHTGYLTDAAKSICYDDDTLTFQVGFEERGDARSFETDLLSAVDTYRSPLENLDIQVSVKQCNAPFPLLPLRRVKLNDYKPDDSASPNDGMSVSAATSVTVLDLSTDIVRYQRIESISRMQHPLALTDKCHIMDKSHCDRYVSYKQFKADENNLLCLTQDMHGYFDGRGKEEQKVPLFKMDYLDHDSHPAANMDHRYRVNVTVTPLDEVAAGLVYPRLIEGSTFMDDKQAMKTYVYVRDPTTFKYCLEWKSKKTAQKWKKHRAEGDRD